MKKRWFVVILTIGLLLCVMPLSALALSSDPITDSDGNIIGWEDLSTDLCSFDDSDVSDVSQEQTPVAVDPGTNAASGPAETDPVKGAAAAYRSSTNGVAEDAAVHDPNADESVPDLYEDPTDSATGTGSDQDACAIGDQTYKTLTEAIGDAADGARIELLRNIELTDGLEFHSKNLTISGGNTYTLTLKEKGIYASNSVLTFDALTLNIYAATHSYEGGAGCTANLITDSDLIMNNVIFTLTPYDPSVSLSASDTGSGIYLHRYSNLYLYGTIAEIHGFKGIKCSGIFADESNIDYDVDPVVNRKIELVGSTLTVTDCGWNGMTINPVDLDLTGSNVYLNHNGKGGLGTYWGKLNMVSSTLTADDNGTGSDDFSKTWGLFVDQLEMDGSSTLNACNNHGVAGILVGDGGVIHGGAKLNCNNNDYIGLYVFLDRDNEWYGDVVIEHGATVTACGNGFSGVHNANKLKIEGTVIADRNSFSGITNDAGDGLTITSTADVSVCQNTLFGIFNYARAKLTVKSGADLKVEENTGSGIANGPNATLNLGAGIVQRNNALYKITFTFYLEGDVVFTAQGGGIQNLGTAILSDDVELYNNHARLSGDDIYNADGATITFGATGSDWALDGYPDCYHPIDGWYDDSVNDRWNAHAEHEDDLHMVLVAPVTSYTDPLSLKAAHGPTGSLIVHKQTTGEQLVDDCDAVFTFVLTLDDENIDTVNDERYGVRFENGKATFTLKDGESKTIENLPVRMGYTITEQSKGGWLLARVDGDAEGKVPYRATAEIAFVNEKQTATGSLVVTKELAGELDADDADTVFNFMLMLDDNTITTADAEEYGVQFENGIASFSLKGGESITIANLPAGVGYTIAEVRQTGWTLQSVSGADTGVVPKNDTAEIVFTNLKNGTDIPDVPVVPTEPEEPTEPETPETPEEPAQPDAPAQDETPGEEPAQDDTTVPAQPAETPAQDTTKADTLPQTGTTGWLAVVLMSFGFGLLACGWFFTRKQRAAKH